MPKPTRLPSPIGRAARLALAVAVVVAAVALLVTVEGQERAAAQPGQERRVGQPGQGRPAAQQSPDTRTDPRAARLYEQSTAPVVDRQHLENLMRAITEDLPYVPGEVLVRYKSGTDTRGQLAALNTLRLNASRTRTRWIGEVLHVVSADIDPPEHAAEVLRRQPEVLYAQPNYIQHPDKLPNDPLYSSQWNLDAINMPQAWDVNWGATTGKNKVIVAVLDTGFTTANGVYNYQLWNGSGFQVFPIPFSPPVDFTLSNVLDGKDFTYGFSRMFDSSGHGTHVAGTIAQQTDNATYYAGIAHGATLLPVKVCYAYWDVQIYRGSLSVPGYSSTTTTGSCPTSAIIAGIQYAVDNGADVINMSLGGTSPNPSERDAMRAALDRGVFFSLSAGNEADDGNPTTYPASYAKDMDGVVAVGAVTRSLKRAYYSSYGSFVELAAPGGDSSGYVYQVVPSSGDLSSSLAAPRYDRYSSGGYSGTSMAAPHVSGVAALLYNQGITRPAGIEAAMKRFAKDLGTAGRDDEYGYGLIDARATLRGMGVAK
jgi:serine protease